MGDLGRTSHRGLPITGRAAIPILRLAIAGGAALIIASSIPAVSGPAASALDAVTLSLVMVLTLLLLRPVDVRGALPLLAWALAGTLFVTLTLAVSSSTGLAAPALMRLALTLFLLGGTLLLLTRLVAVPVVVALAAALTLMPVWAAPLVEVAGNPAWLNRLVVWGSPLTALAVAIDLDYLRAEWFYATSALGSMRYTYPGWTQVVFVLSVMPAGALLLERLRIARPDRHIVTTKVEPC